MTNEDKEKYERIPKYTRKVNGKTQTVRAHVRGNVCPKPRR